MFIFFHSGARVEAQEVEATVPDYDYAPDEDQLDQPEIVTENQTDQLVPGQSLSIKCRVKKLYDNQVRIGRLGLILTYVTLFREFYCCHTL